MKTHATPTSKALKRLRMAEDFEQRSAKGHIVYVMLWGIIGMGCGLWITQPLFFWSVLVCLAAISALRLQESKQHGIRPELKKKLPWLMRTRIFIGIQGAVWGGCMAASVSDLQSMLFLYMAISTAAIVPVATNMFAADTPSSQVHIITMLGPLMIAMVVHQHIWPATALVICYSLFIWINAKRQNQEYIHALNNELELSVLSRTDPLTQLGNRLYFDEESDRITNIMARNNNWVTLLLIDCDHFKHVNDKYGHPVGDACLKHLGGVLKTAIHRTSDLCARYGGEEFVVVYPGMNSHHAQIATERLKQIIEDSPYQGENHTIALTVSIGSVSKQLDSRVRSNPTPELLKQADTALYDAKRSGRNRCELRSYNDTDGVYYSIKNTPPQVAS